MPSSGTSSVMKSAHEPIAVPNRDQAHQIDDTRLISVIVWCWDHCKRGRYLQAQATLISLPSNHTEERIIRKQEGTMPNCRRSPDAVYRAGYKSPAAACAGAGRSVPAICQWPPGVRTPGAVDLQGRLGCGALGVRALGRKQEGPSDSPSRAPRHLAGPVTRSSKRPKCGCT